ncbi:MAG: electron transfer flavoprotein subunit beta/FixA family protein [Gemmatimonadota bacterium]
MRVLVCVKRVPAPGARIAIAADGQSVDTAHLGFTTSPHEECAAEEAVQLVDQHGGESTVLTVGPPEAEEQLRYSISIGVDKGVLVETDGSDWDPIRTAAVITTAIEQLESRDGPFDLILFGNESADSGGYQVGIRVAHALDRPMVNGIKGIDIDGDRASLRRAVDVGFEVHDVALPAVAGVKEGINLPRYPTLKGRLASNKAEIERVAASAETGGPALVRLMEPPTQGSETELLGNGADAVPRVVDVLQELGVV